MPRPYLSVIIPAWNEAARLPLTPVDVDRHLAAQDFTYEVIVVVSPSDDNTLDIVRRFESIIKNLRVIALIENRGRGFALIEGMRAAKGMYRLTMDADNSTTIIEFAKMLPYLTSEHDRYDLVIGSRYLPGSQIDPPSPLTLRILGSITRLLVRIFLIQKISDPNARFKAFSASAAEKIVPLCKLHGWGIDLESITLAKRLGYAIKEVPVAWSYDPGTQQATSKRDLSEYLRLWWNLVHHRYQLPKG